MASTRFRVTFNGFTVVSETWDDATNTDGQHDEVYFTSVNKKLKSNGAVVYGGDTNTFVSATMGDVSSPATLGRRIKAGSAQRPWWQGGGSNGGLINGDQFPPGAPWAPPLPQEIGRDYPPCMIWEDDIADDEVVHVVPSLWEWDGSGGAANGWLNWQVATDAQFGERAKKVFGPAAGAYSWIFDAVSLGIQTAGTLQGQFAPAGQPGDRPIGTTRDPANPNNGVFNPKVIELTRASAEALVTANPTGRGQGVLSIPYVDDPVLRGNYVLYLQLHRIDTRRPDPGNKLLAGQSLRQDQKLFSPSGRFTLWMQNDGHLVLYDGAPAVQTAYWGTNTWGLSAARRPTHVDMQTDGHLVLYNDAMTPAWGSGIYGPNYIQPYLELQDDGNLVIYHNGGQPVWASNTARP
jgi:hypothetical protein